MSVIINVEEIKSRVIQSLHELGIDTTVDSEMQLAEQFDSVLFISTILDLEAVFDIAIPDEFLNLQFFASLDQTTSYIEELIQKQRK